MSWIKRNLYFVVGGVVAAALLGLAGYYFYSKLQLNRQSLEELDKAYADWERITKLNPNPGNNKTNNIGNARQQQERARVVINKVQKYFAPVPPVPNPENGMVTKEDFASALRRTLGQLQRDAANQGVSIPPRYTFSFEAIKDLYTFAPNSLPQLATQLGEVKTICSILFRAKINSLDGIRRERVSSDDLSVMAPQTDYLEATHTAVTNDLAVLAPYEVTFQCFSAELATVLAGFGSTPHGFIVKAINVVPASAATLVTGEPMIGETAPAERMLAPRGYVDPYLRRALAAQAQAAPVAAAPPPVRGGLQTVLDEKPLKVTLVLNVVRLLPRR